MGALSEGDLRAVLDFVGDAYDAQDRAEYRSVLLPGIHRLVNSDYVSYNEVEQGGRAAVTIVAPDLPAWAFAAWNRYAAENPLLQHYLRTRDGRPLRFSDVASVEEVRRTKLYEQLYEPLGLKHQIAFMLPSTPELMIGVAMSRGGRNYTERDRRLLELSRPHLIQAYRGAQLRERLAGILAGLRQGLASDGTAIVVIDSAGVVGFHSAAAGELLDGIPDSLPLQTGRPVEGSLARWLAEGGGTASLPIDGQEDSLLVRSIRGDGGTRVVLLERAGWALSLEALGQLGLTPREAEVLHALARGEDLGAVAGELEVSPRTIAKHIQHIHAKLGVTSRAQAVATAWAAVSGIVLSSTQMLA